MPVPREKTILIIEDNEQNMKLAVDVLALAGFKILQASDGESALETLKTGQPHLILLDMGLPDLHGTEIYRRIRKDPRFKDTKIAAFTASVMGGQKQQLLGLGFDAFIAKPFAVEAFVKEIHALLGTQPQTT